MSQHLPVNLDSAREMGLDDDFLREFALTFLSDVNARLPQVEEHLKFFDGRKLRDVAHSFSGSSTCMGAERLHQLTVELEQAALSGQLQASREAFENFHSELQRVCSFLKEFLEQSQ